MIGFLVTMENMHRNEHVTHVFKFMNKYLIPIIGIYRLAMHAHRLVGCRMSRNVAKSRCKISWIEYTAKYFCSSVINVKCNGYARGLMSAVAREIPGLCKERKPKRPNQERKRPKPEMNA